MGKACQPDVNPYRYCLHQKSDHRDPGRNRDLQETLCPSHWLQTIETKVSEKLEFPRESHAERKKNLKVVAFQSRNLPLQRDKTVLTYGGEGGR